MKQNRCLFCEIVLNNKSNTICDKCGSMMLIYKDKEVKSSGLSAHQEIQIQLLRNRSQDQDKRFANYQR